MPPARAGAGGAYGMSPAQAGYAPGGAEAGGSQYAAAIAHRHQHNPAMFLKH